MNNSLEKKPRPGSHTAEVSLSKIDDLAVKLTSLVIVGSIVWVPSLFLYLYKKWKNTPKEEVQKRAMYRRIFLTLALCAIFGPHRHPKVGKLLKFKKWNLWNGAWLRYISFEVITDEVKDVKGFNLREDPAILAFSPHGIFPFSLGFATVAERAKEYFGEFRPVVATATRFVPILRTVLQWIGQVDASRSEVDRALSEGARIGLAPGGISEMFEGYPKSGRLLNEECVILNSRKGFIRMALKHNLPVVPIYCFGSSALMRRLHFPFLEKMSNLLRVSICIFYGVCGLPIPFRKKLLYVVGKPIHPPEVQGSLDIGSPEFQRQVDEMHFNFCESMTNLFEKYKSSYGWEHKILRIV